MRKNSIQFLIVIGCLFLSNISYAQFKVVGYLPNWGGYPSSINNVDLTKVTHINIAFANPDANGDLAAGSLVDLATVVTAAHAQSVKVLISVGGAGAPGSTYTNLIQSDLSGFVNKLVQYTVDNNLDGIDVDLEGDVLNGTTMTAAQYENFVTALSTGLHTQSKIMTAALASWFATRVTNTAASKFDFINVMSYDEYGTWTGPGQHAPYTSAVSDFNYWNTTKGVPASKLTVGVPFYGYYWGTGNTSYTFATIVTTYPGSENKDMYKPSSGGILYYNGIPTIKQKTNFALNNAGGIMIWQLAGDASGSNSLVSAIDEVKQGYLTNVVPASSISTPIASTVFTEGDTVQIDVNATDSDGNILKVEYFAGTFKIGEIYTAPYILKWTGAGAGTYSLTAKVTDNMGASVTSSAVSITVNAASTSSPFSGTEINIPGKVEAENYNWGGNNVGYYDLTNSNLGGAYRTGKVDMEDCVDVGAGYDVGWTDAGEWLEYSVNIATTGNYDFQTRVATQNAGNTFYISIDGVNVTGSISVPSTGGWQKWQTVNTNNISLTQGVRKMKIVLSTGGFNLNYVNVVSTVTDIAEGNLTEKINMVFPNPVTNSSLIQFSLKETGRVKAVIYDEMGREIIVLSDQEMMAGKNQLIIQRGNFPKGMYWCKIYGEKEVIGIKLVME
jgi:chitinase